MLGKVRGMAFPFVFLLLLFIVAVFGGVNVLRFGLTCVLMVVCMWYLDKGEDYGVHRGRSLNLGLV